MNEMEILKEELEGELPGGLFELDQPRDPEGMWWLDAELDGHQVSVQWSPSKGFGVSASWTEEGYGEGPEEIFPSHEEAVRRVLDLLVHKRHTSPPQELLLRELRALAGLTQEQLAEKLGVQQAAVSRLERHADITISSLRRYVSAVGGDVEINVRLPSGELLRLGSLEKAG